MFFSKQLTAYTLAISLGVTAVFAAPRSNEDQRVGGDNYVEILSQNGGALGDERLVAYVSDLGQSLMQNSKQPDEPWTFTVLDTPDVNAFATRGGYVYVTRGLLALANDEAELAAVLAHEVAHVTADHLGARDDAGKDALRSGLIGALVGGLFAGDEDRLGNAIKSGVMAAAGYMGQFSQSQELEADKIGIRLLIDAGYDPYAAADFLDSLSAKHELESKISGREYNPNSVSFFASHPATAERIRKAIGEAGRSGQDTVGNPRYEADYLDMIEGMIYGDTAAQGLVRGRTFSHADLGFTFTVPEGFVIKNTSNTVRASGPNGAMLIFSGDRHRTGSLTRYISNTWARQISRQERTEPLQDLRSLKIDGLEAATAVLPVHGRGGLVFIQLTVIRTDGQLYRFSGTSKEGDPQTRADLLQAAESFETLSRREAGRLHAFQIEIHKVSRRDSVETLAASMPFDTFNEERFRTLNGLEPDGGLHRGELVKLIVE